MFYAKLTEDHAFGFPEEHYIYEFARKSDRDLFVRMVNDESESHRNYRGHDVWPCLYTKYDHAEAIPARDARKLMQGDGFETEGRWTFYTKAIQYKAA